jgi:hypothetical protein
MPHHSLKTVELTAEDVAQSQLVRRLAISFGVSEEAIMRHLRRFQHTTLTTKRLQVADSETGAVCGFNGVSLGFVSAPQEGRLRSDGWFWAATKEEE